MKNETAIGQTDQYRLMLLVEHLQRQDRSEDEIVAAVREATTNEAATDRES